MTPLQGWIGIKEKTANKTLSMVLGTCWVSSEWHLSEAGGWARKLTSSLSLVPMLVNTSRQWSGFLGLRAMPELLGEEQLLLVISVYEEEEWRVNMKAPPNPSGKFMSFGICKLGPKLKEPNGSLKRQRLSLMDHLCIPRTWRVVGVNSKKAQNSYFVCCCICSI